MIREIFYGSELTVDINGCILNKWHPRKKSINIPNNIVQYLINNLILEETGGNFETGEIHYIYNSTIGDYFKLDKSILNDITPIFREIRINKLI